MKLSEAMERAVTSELTTARMTDDSEIAWRALVRAHVLSQPDLTRHIVVHTAMLAQAVHERDSREIAGQLLRLALAPLGHLLGRTPWGNPGRATVSKFAKAPLPADVARLYAEAGIKVT